MTFKHRWLKKPTATTEQMLALYKEGLSGTQIAKRLGLAKSSVTRRLKKAGVELRTSSSYEGKKRYWLWKDLNRDPLERKRSSMKHRKWSHAVLGRDNNTCQKCGLQGKNYKHRRTLHAHHIIALRDCIDSRLEFEISNGITLCTKCHKLTHISQRA